MLKRKALRKILITTFAIFTLFVVYLISDTPALEELQIEPQVEYMASLGMDEVYLLGNNGYLVKTNTLLDASDIKGKIEILIDYLTIQKNRKMPVGLSGVLPSATKVYGITVENDIVTLNLSKEVWEGDSSLHERMIESLTYSITSLDGIHGLKLQVEGILVTEIPSTKKMLPEILTKDYGINKVYDIDSSSGIKKVTTYYLNQINEETYYVPVTKYMNDKREKIDIIIDELSSAPLYHSNLMSFLNQNVKLLAAEEAMEQLNLEFNSYIFNDIDEKNILEEVIYTICLSVGDNYDVKEVSFIVDSEEIYKSVIKTIE